MIHNGEILFGRYRVQCFLGEGAFGAVYLAEHINLKVSRALKCIAKCQDIHGTAMREADILKNLRHSAIPIIYDIEENDEYICIVEEYAEGMSLKSLISNSNKITDKKIVMLGLELCNVTEYLHSKGIFHRDIKPDNIIINNGRVKLLDYGNSIRLGSDSRTQFGTKGYSAPELYTNAGSKAAGDIYSIGVVMLVMATGSKEADAIERVRSKELRSIITACICHSATERIETVSKLAKRLKRLARKKLRTENVPLRIGFAGVAPNTGTTHCALMAAHALKKEGRIALCEKNDSGGFFELIKDEGNVVFKRGSFRIDGLDYIPEYNECVNLDFLKDYDRVIYDYGIISEDNLEEIMSMDWICLVTLGGACDIREYLGLNPLIFADKEKLTTIINLAGIKTYKQRVRDDRIINPVRCGYNPDV